MYQKFEIEVYTTSPEKVGGIEKLTKDTYVERKVTCNGKLLYYDKCAASLALSDENFSSRLTAFLSDKKPKSGSGALKKGIKRQEMLIKAQEAHIHALELELSLPKKIGRD